MIWSFCCPTVRLLVFRILICSLIGLRSVADEPAAGTPELGVQNVQDGTNPELQWQVGPAPSSLKVSTRSFQEKSQQIHRIWLSNSGRPQAVTISSPRRVSRIHDDFRATVRIHSTNAGIQLALEVVLPHQKDPRTGQPITTMMMGSVYRRDNTWQTLHVAGTVSALETQLRRLRVELHRSDINARNAYINGMALIAEAGPGETFIDISSSEYGPVVADSSLPVRNVTASGTPAEAAVREPGYIPLHVELNHVLLNRQPRILRFAPDHGEELTTLSQLGLNAAWVPDGRDPERTGALYEAGLAVLATPPQPAFEPGDYSRVLQALPPLNQLCPRVSAWLLGTRVSPDQLPHFLALSRETRSADRELRRPQMADVTAAEGAASREIELVGIGRHVIGRDENLGLLRNQTFRRQRGAGQLSLPWMWIQTEPAGHQQAWRLQTGSTMPHVEPEQIMAQAYAALSAGCKGIGFWKTRRLLPENPLDQETLGAIELVNLELSLLEPLLARGRVDGHLLIQSGNDDNSTARRSAGSTMRAQPWFQSALSSSPLASSAMAQEEPEGPDATVITSGGAMLILVNHWDNVSQFVPAQMSAREITLIVAASETASAWQLSTTGVRALRQEITAGGLRLRIQDFDRHAAILITSDPEQVRALEKSIYQVAERSSQLTLQLATLKYQRTLVTLEELREVSDVPSEVSRLLTQARQSLDRAGHESRQNDFNETVVQARTTLRILRQIQQLCWKEAVRDRISPAFAPHTVSFATLPDHWEMLSRIQQRSGYETANLLPEDYFQNWQKSVSASAGYLCTADVISEPSMRQPVLRLAAWLAGAADSSGGPRGSETPLVVTSPAIAVQGGDIVKITGRCRKGRIVPARTKRPLLMFDSELGPEYGLHTAVETEWKPFEIIREISPRTTQFHFSMALTGVAEVQLSDLTLTRFPPVPADRFQGPRQPAPLRLTGQIRAQETQEP